MRLNNKGFTLIEVLTVLVIISILGVIVVPNTMGVIKSGKKNTYKILVANIKESAINMYKELEYSDSELYYYKKNEKEIINISDDNKLEINLASLVKNGFLTGDKVEEGSVINPVDNSDMGECRIVITKKVDDNNYKVSYVIESIDNSNKCPTSSDYKEGV